MTIGTLSGYLIGNFAKQITDAAIWYVGMSALLVGGLHYMNWMTVNFDQIDKDVLHIVEKAKEAEEKGAFDKIIRFVLRVAPLMGGFGAGFYFGFCTG